MKLLPILKKAADHLFKGGYNSNKAKVTLKYPEGILNKTRFMFKLIGISIPVIGLLLGFILVLFKAITFEQFMEFLRLFNPFG